MRYEDGVGTVIFHDPKCEGTNSVIIPLEEAIKKHKEITEPQTEKQEKTMDNDKLNKIFLSYIDNVMAYINVEKVENQYTGRYEAPNEELMRAIEKKIGVSACAVDDFRRSIAAYAGKIIRNEGKDALRYDRHPTTAQAIRILNMSGYFDPKPPEKVSKTQFQVGDVVRLKTRIGSIPVGTICSIYSQNTPPGLVLSYQNGHGYGFVGALPDEIELYKVKTDKLALVKKVLTKLWY